MGNYRITMSKISCLGLCLALLIGALLLQPVPVSAAESNLEIEEIVVTARRRSESLQDVPGAVTAISEATIEDAGVERAADFIKLTPGVSLVDAAEVGDTQVNIRGINGARDAESSFAYIVDGVLFTNTAAFNREYPNLQQIEVFKGPQGAIYGRNAAAGAVIVTTKKPGNELAGNVKASFAEDDTTLFQGSLGGAIVQDELFFHLSASQRESDGFYNNSFLNDDSAVDRFEDYAFTGRLIWEPTEALSIDVKTRYAEVDASAITFNATFSLPNFAAAAGAPLANEDVNDHNFVFQPNIVSENNQEAFEFSAKFDYLADWGTITGWALYSDIQNDFIADGTSAAFGFFNNNAECIASTANLNAAGVTLPAPQILGTTPVGILFTPDFSGSFFGPYTPTTCDGLQEQIRDQEDLSFELRIASAEDQALRWNAGVYYLDIDRQVGVSLNTDSGQRPIRGLLQASGPNRTEALVFDDFDSEVFAVFGGIQYDLSDSLELSLALRYDREERDVSNLVPTNLTSTVIDLNFDGIFNDPLNPGLSDLINPTGVIPDQSATFEEVQPKVSLRWDATENLSVYGNWGRGFKAGGFNNQGSAASVDIFINGFINSGNFADQLGVPLPSIQDTFDEETSDAFELGFKARLLDGRVKIEGAAYYVEVDDSQFFEFFVGTFGLLRVVSNIDEVEIYGFEIAAEARLTDYLTAYVGYNIIETEIEENSARPDTVGNDVPYTPDYTANVGLTLDIPVTDGINFFARIDAQSTGETSFHTVQEGLRPTIFSPLFEISVFGAGSGGLGFADFGNTRRDSFETVDIRAGFRGERWSVIGFVSNLTDEEFLEEVIPAPEFGGAFDAPGTRRRAGLELSYTF